MDELTARREAADRAPAPSNARSRRALTDGGGGGGGEGPGGGSREKPPPLWRWFTTQTAHSDPEKAAAARAVRERWDLPVTRFSKIDRTLAGEESTHLVPFRQLLDEYRQLFVPDDTDGSFARETGADGMLVPLAVERCDQCTRDAVPGTGKCGRHGGQWITPTDLQVLSRRIQDRLWLMSETSLRVLQDLMDNGRSEQVRLMAATAVLDRAGVGPHMTVRHDEVGPEARDEAVTKLNERLDRLAADAVEKAELARKLVGVEDAEIVDEEVATAAEVEG